MQMRSDTVIFLLVLWVIVAVLAWPMFVSAATLLAFLGGEARQLDAWAMEPQARLVADFLIGWKASAVVAVSVGLVAVVDYLLLSRYRITWLIGGILIPLSGAVIASTRFEDPRHAMPTLVLSGVGLALVYRLVEALRSRGFGR